ncbi:hypothetical protein N007_10960 [Alicyclobacillus acidoterrestris ATCC 49025]|nr:hypothetical protein N007_10960 [Alicyclobacillus acidoterrestris ATCC 49025]
MEGIGSIGFGEGIRAEDVKERKTYQVPKVQTERFMEMTSLMYP